MNIGGVMKTKTAALALAVILSLTGGTLSAGASPSPKNYNIPQSPTTSKLEPCRIKAAGFVGSTIRAGFPQHQDYVSGKKRPVIQLIYVDASNLQHPSKPSEDVDYWINGAGKFLNDMAEGKVKFQWRYENKYFRLAKPIEQYGLTRTGGGDAHGFVQAAITAADAEVDFTNVDFVVAVLPPNVTRSQVEYSPALPLTKSFPFKTQEGLVYRGTLAGADTRGNEGFLLIAHEMGHLLGLQDYYSYEWKPGDTFEEQFKYLGQFDNMNFAPGNSREWIGWSRWLLGYLSDRQVRCVVRKSTTTQKLTAISSTAVGHKLAVIPTGPNTAVVIESRRNTRHDSKASAISNGLLVYQVNTTKTSGFGPIRIVKNKLATDLLFADAPLKVGQSLSVSGWTIKNIEAGQDWDIVQITKN
jgi:M6 family metalloprotease-like protein